MRGAALAGLAALALGCAASLARPTPADEAWAAQRWPGTTLADLERGRELYVRRCSACHNLFLPRQFAPERWPGLVGKMAQKKPLGADESEAITRFLVTASAQPSSAK